jgi:hypothetical protein
MFMSQIGSPTGGPTQVVCTQWRSWRRWWHNVTDKPISPPKQNSLTKLGGGDDTLTADVANFFTCLLEVDTHAPFSWGPRVEEVESAPIQLYEDSLHRHSRWEGHFYPPIKKDKHSRLLEMWLLDRPHHFDTVVFEFTYTLEDFGLEKETLCWLTKRSLSSLSFALFLRRTKRRCIGSGYRNFTSTSIL